MGHITEEQPLRLGAHSRGVCRQAGWNTQAAQGHTCCSGLPGLETWGTKGQWAAQGTDQVVLLGGATEVAALESSENQQEPQGRAQWALKTGASARDGVEGGFRQRCMKQLGRAVWDRKGHLTRAKPLSPASREARKDGRYRNGVRIWGSHRVRRLTEDLNCRRWHLNSVGGSLVGK